jgi:lipopolysaccharide assembly outer membrane protein LptD (OstA)
MMKKTLFIALFLAVFCFFAAAQELENSPDTISSLIQRVNILDIEASSPDEMRAWLHRLGLSPDGAEGDLRIKLYNHYNLERPRLQEEFRNVESVRITSADKAEYRIGPDGYSGIAVLRGDTVLEFQDSDSGSRYSIKADTVIFNRYTGFISAAGNVQYSRTDIDSDEVLEKYTSSSLSFSLEEWSGTIRNALTEGSRVNSEGDTVAFELRGKTLEKSTEGFLTVKNGIISTPGPNPYISIHAGKISLLPGGDWFAVNAVARFGRIPILYLPFFYYPGVSFFFNPSFGISQNRGYFVNTTTAVFGNLPAASVEKTSFSLFLTQENDQSADIPGISGSLFSMNNMYPEIRQWADATRSYMAVTFDVFEKKGISLGIAGDFNDFWGLDSFTISGAVILDPINQNPLVRFYSIPQIQADADAWKFTLSMPLYSDSKVMEDFASRKTFFELKDITGTAVFPDSFSTLTDFNWKLSGSFRPDVSNLNPYIKSIQVSSFSSDLYWSIDGPWQYTISSATVYSQSGTVSGDLFKAEAVKRQNIPESPSELSSANGYSGSYPPQLLNGSLLYKDSDEINSMNRDNDSLPDADMLPPPYIVPDFSLPSAIPDVKQTRTAAAISLSYNLRESGSTILSFDDGKPQYTKTTEKFDAGVTLATSFMDSAYSIKNILKPTGFFQVHYDISGDTPDFSSYLEQDKEKSQVAVLNEFYISIPVLSLSYTLKTRVLNWDFDSDLLNSSGDYRLKIFEWGDSDVLQHTVKAAFPIKPINGSLSLSAVLPPFNYRLDPKLTAAVSGMSVSLSSSLLEKDDGSIHFDPLYLRIALNPVNLPFSGQITAGWNYAGAAEDLNAGFPADIEGYLEIDLGKNMLFRQKAGYDFSTESWDNSSSRLQWRSTFAELSLLAGTLPGDSLFDFTPDNIKIYTPLKISELSFWHNRIVLSASILSSWAYSFQEPNENLLTVSFAVDFKIEEFLEITVTSRSRNNAFNKYFDGSVNIFEDLYKSFNFFNIDDRYDSNFNLDSIQLEVKHIMQQWDLVADYNGTISLNMLTDKYEWRSAVSVYISWKGVPEIDLTGSIKHDESTGKQELIILQGEE